MPVILVSTHCKICLLSGEVFSKAIKPHGETSFPADVMRQLEAPSWVASAIQLVIGQLCDWEDIVAELAGKHVLVFERPVPAPICFATVAGSFCSL